MDPIYSIGLAGNVAQLVEFAARLVNEGNKLYHTADGVSIENKETATVSEDLSKLSTSLVESLRAWSTNYGVSSHDEVDDQLKTICEGCKDIADELLTKLQKLNGTNSRRTRFASYKQALISVWQKEDIEKIAKRLKNIRINSTRAFSTDLSLTQSD